MKKLKTFLVGLVAVLSGCARSAPQDKDLAMKWNQEVFWSLGEKSLEGGRVDFSIYENKVVIVVNVASKCGFTGQYKGLQEIYEEYKDDGLVILGFPSNEFGGQEPGSNQEIRSFCTKNYGVTFPMFSKVQTAPGESQSPVYEFLGVVTGKLPGWNFGKYLIRRDGKSVTFFDSMTSPYSDSFKKSVEDAIVEL